MWLSITKLSTKENLLKEVIIRTKAGVSIHEGMFKDITVGDDIIITDKSNEPRVIIDRKALFDKRLLFKINGSPEIKQILSYEL